MRVAIWHNLPSGGGQRALYDHVSGLLRRGHVVEIWSPPTADRSMLDVNSLAPYHEVALGQPRLGRADLPGWMRGAVPEFSLAAMDNHCKAAATQINSGGFDILLSGTCMQFNAAPIARHVDIPSVLYLQEPHRLLYEAPNVLLRPLARDATVKGALKRLVDLVEVDHARRQARDEAANASAFDSILVNSFFSAESVNRAYDLVSRVCYLGLDSTLWRVQHRAAEQVSVVGIGTIAPHKRVDFVIDALAASGVADCKLHWIGNAVYPDYAADLKTQATKLGVDLTLHIAVSHSAMLEVLAEASLLAYAPRLEPFGYAPLECGAAGIPTVAVAEGGIRETVVDGVNGLLTSRDPEEMGCAIRTLVQDGRLRESLGTNAQKCVDERWSLEAAVDRLESELSRVLLTPRRNRRA
jgi:glycosyltransferase involved in cell wall biosynthesis